MKSPKATKLSSPKETPVIDLPSQPDESEMVLRLLSRYRYYQEEDVPEEVVNRLSSMALMLSNIAAAHRVARADGVEADLGVRFAVEGGFLSSDIKQSVIEPAFRFQKNWERSLLHDVDMKSDPRSKPRREDSREFYDEHYLPGPRFRKLYTELQKNYVLAEQEIAKRSEEQAQRTAQIYGAPVRFDQQHTAAKRQNANLQKNPYSAVPKVDVVTSILGIREDTYFREAMDYRVFFAEETPGEGLDSRVMQAHLGRFVVYSSIDSYNAFEHMGKMLNKYSIHGNYRRADASLTLRADPVIFVAPGILNEAISRGLHHIDWYNRILWLVESAAGYDLPDRAAVEEEPYKSVLNFQDACHNEISHRINFTNRQEHDLPALTGHLASWRKFLREQESHHPGIAGSAWNLPFALCYGLEAICNHQVKAVGEEVMALARWLVVRMTNRLAAVSSSEQISPVNRLANKLAVKLATYGPMTVRQLTRKCSRLSMGSCRKALECLEDLQVASLKDTKWGIRADYQPAQSFAEVKVH